MNSGGTYTITVVLDWNHLKNIDQSQSLKLRLAISQEKKIKDR
jgi:hypothetical protein